ncbi:pyrrolidone-carboxylate peptidase [Nitzschia inconspicua]|uniref:Pyrrolidone-carboxylate peptidase n=1 Tax=Nitzschia inconspicua TaxID=303405 RepID=A0A9K3L731_9STRA|nr:pyrrolidone-carboxylate peptidase [Nitzschia inconspicua]
MSDRQSFQNDVIVAASNSVPRIIVTGFGPFGGVTDNPTTVIVRKLRSFLEQADKFAHLATLVEDCIILETSVQDVNQTCDRLEAQFSKNSGEGEKDEEQTRRTTIILLHLGVDEGTSIFKVESCAYNEANFRIPDQQGRQPRNVSIFEEEEYQSCLRTSLDVQNLAQCMKRCFPHIGTMISTDPGRYVCNYVYCCSLQRFGKLDASICSLFLHVPPFSAVPEQQQLEYVAGLLDALAGSNAIRE